MKPNLQARVATVSNADERITLGLDPTAAAHLITVLTDLYSDPILAVIREYSTNARDSHLEADQTKPIEVVIDSVRRTLIIRDFGLGLDMQGLEDTYSLYGRSTKRESDLVNGVLGLGCKSALTYADTFGITAIKNGHKILAVITKNDEGIGEIRVLNSHDTKEPSGVEISIPIKQPDMAAFQSKAAEFFYYWRADQVLLNGIKPPTIWDDETVLWLADDLCVRKPKPRAGYNQPVQRNNQDMIVQHGVAYPMKQTTQNTWGYNQNHLITAFVESGAVNFTPSREQLHLTARTVKVVKEVEERTKKLLPEIIEKKINRAPTGWERAKTYVQWSHYLGRTLADKYVVKRKEERTAHPNNPKVMVTTKTGTALYIGVTYDGGKDAEWENYDQLTPSEVMPESRTLMVTGYDKTLLSFKAKVQIIKYLNHKDLSRVVIVPHDAEGQDWLEGFPEMATWKDVEEFTVGLKVKPGSALRAKTKYQCFKGNKHIGDLTLDQILDLKEEVAFDNYRNGQFTTMMPDAVMIVARPASEELLKRHIPKIKRSSALVLSHVTKLQNQLTESDMFIMASHQITKKWPILTRLPAYIADPLLRDVIASSKQPLPNTCTELNRLGATQDYVPLTTVSKIATRYPLLGHLYQQQNLDVSEIHFYVNMKYDLLARGGKL